MHLSPPRLIQALVLPALALALAAPAFAQGNYEIQVYGADLVKPGNTMFELHSNYTAEGFTTEQQGVWPDQGQEHETLEITHGFTPWFETGFYVFTSLQNGHGWNWVGDHIRPRFSVPDSWHWPVGFSVSQEIGYQRPAFSPDTWTYELRPIVDKQMGRLYWAVNPALEKSIHGPNAARGFEFSPGAQVGWDLNPKVNVALEYYGSVGPVTGFDPLREQQQQIFPAVNLNVSPQWEFNFGVGVGMTSSTEHLIFKMILGRRFNF